MPLAGEMGWGGGAHGEPEAATQSRSRSRAQSHTSADPIRVLCPKPGQAPHTWNFDPAPPPPPPVAPKILEPGHQPCPPRTRLPRAQTPQETEVASFSLTPPNTRCSHHQFQIGRKPKKVPAKLSEKCGAGQGPERSGAQSWVGWVRWGGQAEKRPFESRSRETTALPPPTSLP